jgi:hypothetical protein
LRPAETRKNQTCFSLRYQQTSKSRCSRHTGVSCQLEVTTRKAPRFRFIYKIFRCSVDCQPYQNPTTINLKDCPLTVWARFSMQVFEPDDYAAIRTVLNECA